MEEELKRKASLPDFVDPTSLILPLIEIKKEFSFLEPNEHGRFIENAVGSVYLDMNSKLKKEEEIKPESTTKLCLAAFGDSTCDAPDLNEIKKEFSLSELNLHGASMEHDVVTHENSSSQSLGIHINSEFPDVKCGIDRANHDIYIKHEPLTSEELDIKTEIDQSATDQTKEEFTQVESFTCGVCCRTFSCKAYLQQHMKIHTGVKVKCSICDYRCVQKGSLQRHMKIHTGEKPFKCRVCDYRSIHKSSVQQHMMMHAGEKSFKCSICDYRCVHKSSLQRHMKTHTGEKPFKCSVCDYRCIHKSSLQYHMTIHTGLKPFKCSVCDYRCIQKSCLQQHMKIHTGENPFKCSLCDYRSVRRGSLKRHIKTHTAEFFLKCSVCDLKCVNKSSLKRHMKIHPGENA